MRVREKRQNIAPYPTHLRRAAVVGSPPDPPLVVVVPPPAVGIPVGTLKMTRAQLCYVKLSDRAVPPRKSNPQSAGYDLCAAYPMTIPKLGKALVPTELALKIPEGYYGRIAPRSGLAWEHFIDVGAGVIDGGSFQKAKILLFNFSFQDYKIKQGERVAQLIIEKLFVADEVVECEKNSLPEDLLEGKHGFGSTGKKW